MKDLILDRAAEVVVPGELPRLLDSKKLRIKHGIDPTAPRLHLGRASTVRRLRALQDMGHQIVLIIGDFTAKIGDASDKTSERQPLSDQQIKQNMADYTDQLGLILDMDKVELRHNSEWLSGLSLAEVIALAQQFTVAQMIERENFRDRYANHKPIGLHEFLYPVLQGYDSVAVKADVEVGGTDQLFNMMAGRIVQKQMGQTPQQVITFELLVGADGRKMSSSWGNVIDIADNPRDMFGKLMTINDELIGHYYRICTDLPSEAIQQMVSDIAAGANPRDTKASLAREIVRLYHGDGAADQAQQAFDRQFRDGQAPQDLPEEKISKSSWDPVELLVSLKLAESKSDARRLIVQGGVRLNEQKIEGDTVKVKTGDVLQVGKRRFLKLKVK